MAHMFNTLARFCTHLAALYGEKGVRGAIYFIRQTYAALWLNDKQRVLELPNRPFRLQFEQRRTRSFSFYQEPTSSFPGRGEYRFAYFQPL